MDGNPPPKVRAQIFRKRTGPFPTLPRNLFAKSLPLIEEGALLFIWLGAEKDAAAKLLPTITDNNLCKNIINTYKHELLLYITTRLQNILFLAHIHFAHDGKIGCQAQADSILMTIVRRMTAAGFRAYYFNGVILVNFRAPSFGGDYHVGRLCVVRRGGLSDETHHLRHGRRATNLHGGDGG